VIQVDTPLAAEPLSLAALIVNLPSAPAGAGWQLRMNGPVISSGVTYPQGLTPATYTLIFTPETGFLAPANTNVVLTGGNLNTITASYIPQTYNAWSIVNFTPTEQNNVLLSGIDAIYSGDGIANLLKFAFNLNPKANVATVMVAGTGTGGLPLIGTVVNNGQTYLTLEYVRRIAANNPGITYHAEFNGNLSSSAGWSAAGTESVTPIDATWERVKVTDQTPSAPARFGRIRVSQP
jgi:hypothetical protein